MSGILNLNDIDLTEDQKNWLGDRMTESHTGRVSVPPYVCEKFRKITNREFLTNEQVKDYLIQYVY